MPHGLEADPVTVTVFLLLFASVAGIGLFAARWRKRDLSQLTEWGLGGRRFGTLITWFLLGGDLYTAYTFIAVPALMFGAGATGFFAVPYGMLVYPLLFVGVSRACGRWRASTAMSPPPISCAAVLASEAWRWRWRSPASSPPFPTSRCSCSGMQVVIAALGIQTLPGLAASAQLGAADRLPVAGVLHLFQRTARHRPDRRGQGHPDLCHGAGGGRDHPDRAGRLWQDLRQHRSQAAAAGARHGRQSGARALPMPRWRWARFWRCFSIPMRSTGMLSSSSRDVVERNAIILPIYSFALALIALLGFMAVAAGVKAMPEYAGGFESFGNNFAVPALFLSDVSQLVRGRGLRRHRHRRAGAGRDHVHRLRQSFHPQYLSRVHRARLHARRRKRSVAKIVAFVAKLGALVLRAGAEKLLCHRAAASGRHLDLPDRAGGAGGAFHPRHASHGAC